MPMDINAFIHKLDQLRKGTPMRMRLASKAPAHSVLSVDAMSAIAEAMQDGGTKDYIKLSRSLGLSRATTITNIELTDEGAVFHYTFNFSAKCRVDNDPSIIAAIGNQTSGQYVLVALESNGEVSPLTMDELSFIASRFNWA